MVEEEGVGTKQQVTAGGGGGGGKQEKNVCEAIERTGGGTTDRTSANEGHQQKGKLKEQKGVRSKNWENWRIENKREKLTEETMNVNIKKGKKHEQQRQEYNYIKKS